MKGREDGRGQKERWNTGRDHGRKIETVYKEGGTLIGREGGGKVRKMVECRKGLWNEGSDREKERNRRTPTV